MTGIQPGPMDRGVLVPGRAPLTQAIAPAVRIGLGVLVASILCISLLRYGSGFRQYTYLANAFLHGKFSVDDLPSYYPDKVVLGGHTYAALTPMPALLAMPVVAVLGTSFDEIALAYPFTLANILLLLLLLRRLRVDRGLRKPLLALFFCGTVYLPVLANGRSWLLAHIVATTFLLLAVDEVLSRRRSILIGVWLGAAFLSRSTTLFSLPFFVLMLLPSGDLQPRAWIRLGARLLAGLAVPVCFYLYYNYARFGNPFESGYVLSIAGTPALADALKLGLFSVAHLPKNLYALLLAGPQAFPSFAAPALQFPFIYPSPWGLSIFLTTPAFVYAFAADRRERLVRAAWVACGCILVPLLLYFGNGWAQFGYRYALDLYPFLFLPTSLGIARHFDRTARILIVASILVCVWGAWWEVLGFDAFPVM